MIRNFGQIWTIETFTANFLTGLLPFWVPLFEKICVRYTSQYRHASPASLLIEEFVIAVEDLLVYAYYNRGTNLVPKDFE
jgi:hypothetical protein